MNVNEIIQSLERQAAIINLMVKDISAEQWRWKPHPDKWSVLEVINHLVDEERDDFRKRINLTLNHPGETWPPIDPPRWVVEHRYNERDISESLIDFMNERNKSLEWLAGLKSADWSQTYEHPKVGKVQAGDLLTAWCAHDLFHIRQLANLHLAWLEAQAAPFSTRYAF